MGRRTGEVRAKAVEGGRMGERRLSADELAVLELLWGGKTQREAAEVVGVSRRTVQYWVKRAAFRAEWEARQAAARREFDAAIRNMAAAEPHPMEKRLTGLGRRWGERIHAANTIVADMVRVVTWEQRKERKKLLREIRKEAGRMSGDSVKH